MTIGLVCSHWIRAGASKLDCVLIRPWRCSTRARLHHFVHVAQPRLLLPEHLSDSCGPSVCDFAGSVYSPGNFLARILFEYDMH